jgi:hypothetical protein
MRRLQGGPGLLQTAFAVTLLRLPQPLAMRLVIPIPRRQSRIALVREQKVQGARFNMPIAENDV